MKLEIAVDQFGLGERIRGARAVDVGASTGGFTSVLLARGAKTVLAVDVGRGQLHPSLARDARVQNLEQTDWKILSLSVAPGPFDFFTVDVSFVAARNMLRSLAFRLRPGAEGVVLVKPQFELPDRARPADGGGDDATWRARALQRFTAKARDLGFRVLSHMDSTVPGGAGTVEVLAHLCFDGRPEHMPTRGQPAAAPRTKATARTRVGAKATATTEKLNWFAVAAPGLELAVLREVERLEGVTGATAVAGGVEFSGPLGIGMAANLHLRIATRILVRVGEVRAREFGKLRWMSAKLPWAPFISRDRPVAFTASASRSRLYHTGAIAETMALALADAVGALPTAAPEGEGTTRILVRGVDDRFTFSIDASGDLLHKRGARVETGKAPVRETLAAGMLALAGWNGLEPLCDPLCGAGSLVIEACSMALRRAPGIDRSFAFERWPMFDAAAWQRLRAAARSAELAAPPAAIFGSDRSERAIETTRRNAERAGLLAHMTIEKAEISAAPVPSGARGLVVANPPYGHRLQGGPTLWRNLGRALRERFAGWRAAILAPSAVHKAIGLPIRQTHDLRNGGIRTQLALVEIP